MLILPISMMHLVKPELVKIFVMLGLLGTFLGLFQTLAGTKEALGASADIAQLKAGLVAPMTGLTRSFGCSAAGVAASATLGLALALTRRAEAACLLAFDQWAKKALAPFTPQAKMQSALVALVGQGTALPEAARALADAAAALVRVETTVREGQAAQGAGAQSRPSHLEAGQLLGRFETQIARPLATCASRACSFITLPA